MRTDVRAHILFNHESNGFVDSLHEIRFGAFPNKMATLNISPCYASKNCDVVSIQSSIRFWHIHIVIFTTRINISYVCKVGDILAIPKTIEDLNLLLRSMMILTLNWSIFWFPNRRNVFHSVVKPFGIQLICRSRLPLTYLL